MPPANFPPYHPPSDAFAKAAHPDRLFVGVVEQNAEGDIPCLQTLDDIACDANSPSVLCKFGKQIRLYKQAARDATGPIFARHVGDRLYRGEYYTLQTDAHMTFVKGWDIDVIGQVIQGVGGVELEVGWGEMG